MPYNYDSYQKRTVHAVTSFQLEIVCAGGTIYRFGRLPRTVMNVNEQVALFEHDYLFSFPYYVVFSSIFY